MSTDSNPQVLQKSALSIQLTNCMSIQVSLGDSLNADLFFALGPVIAACAGHMRLTPPKYQPTLEILMRSLIVVIAILAGSLATPAIAQNTTDWPVGEQQVFILDSGLQDNPAIEAQTVFSEMVTLKDAAWLRVYFSVIQLEAGSFVRITSLADQEVQELDADGFSMWGNTSAYFNGNTLLVELVAAPRTTKNRFVIDQVAMQAISALPAGTCGICGPDDRVPSDEDWACRLLPAGCTASVWNTSSCLVSAGHCMGGQMVI